MELSASYNTTQAEGVPKFLLKRGSYGSKDGFRKEILRTPGERAQLSGVGDQDPR
jgi:hypothetical protein